MAIFRNDSELSLFKAWGVPPSSISLKLKNASSVLSQHVGLEITWYPYLPSMKLDPHSLCKVGFESINGEPKVRCLTGARSVLCQRQQDSTASCDHDVNDKYARFSRLFFNWKRFTESQHIKLENHGQLRRRKHARSKRDGRVGRWIRKWWH